MISKFYKNLPVLVTGGAGFIGSHVVKKLVSLGAQVTVLDLQDNRTKNLQEARDKIHFIQASITDFDICLAATKNKEIVFHLAAFISVPESVENPQACHETNVNGTFNLLQACKVNNTKRFVFSSSAAVYGPTEKICCESDTCKPTSPYGTSKLIGELLCQQYAHNYGLQTVCLRYFNVFGKNQNPNGAYAAVVAKFMDQMEQNKPITIFGDGQQTRDFIPVQNVVEANLQLGIQDKTIMNGRPFNIATGRSITLLELFENLQKEFPNYTLEPVFAPARAGDIKHSQANTNNWQSIVYTAEGEKTTKAKNN